MWEAFLDISGWWVVECNTAKNCRVEVKARNQAHYLVGLLNSLEKEGMMKKPKTKMWQWIIRRGNARPEATFEYYSSEKELMEDLNSRDFLNYALDVVIIQRADWTCIEVEL